MGNNLQEVWFQISYQKYSSSTAPLHTGSACKQLGAEILPLSCVLCLVSCILCILYHRISWKFLILCTGSLLNPYWIPIRKKSTSLTPGEFTFLLMQQWKGICASMKLRHILLISGSTLTTSTTCITQCCLIFNNVIKDFLFYFIFNFQLLL